MSRTTIRISDEAWLALKQVMFGFKQGKAEECRGFAPLLDAIGWGNDELVALFRKKFTEVHGEKK